MSVEGLGMLEYWGFGSHELCAIRFTTTCRKCKGPDPTWGIKKWKRQRHVVH